MGARRSISRSYGRTVRLYFESASADGGIASAQPAHRVSLHFDRRPGIVIRANFEPHPFASRSRADTRIIGSLRAVPGLRAAGPCSSQGRRNISSGAPSWGAPLVERRGRDLNPRGALTTPSDFRDRAKNAICREFCSRSPVCSPRFNSLRLQGWQQFDLSDRNSTRSGRYHHVSGSSQSQGLFSSASEDVAVTTRS